MTNIELIRELIKLDPNKQVKVYINPFSEPIKEVLNITNRNEIWIEARINEPKRVDGETNSL